MCVFWQTKNRSNMLCLCTGGAEKVSRGHWDSALENNSQQLLCRREEQRHGSQSKIGIFGILVGYCWIGRGYHRLNLAPSPNPKTVPVLDSLFSSPSLSFVPPARRARSCGTPPSKCREPPSKVNQTFFVIESATTTTFEVHAECIVKMCVYSPRPRCTVGTVYLEESYHCQQDDLSLFVY